MRRSVRVVRCTGVTAHWCPIHGNCSCPDPDEAMDDGACPLHRPDGSHPEKRARVCIAAAEAEQ